VISREDIENLAQLSRLKLSEAEFDSLQKDFDSILDYVGQIRSAEVGNGTISAVHNVMRDDVVGGTPESDRETLLNAAPKREGDYVVVRKIIEKDVE
jgi:aspartyl-tRNA(Asn)/glutamyl-tRNA(Gln) amidotransferase subunit C